MKRGDKRRRKPRSAIQHAGLGAALTSPVPPRLRPTWDERRKIQRWANRLRRWIADSYYWQKMDAVQDIDLQAIRNAAESVLDHLDKNLPYAPCQECLQHGHGDARCQCGGKGWLSKLNADEQHSQA